MKIWLRHTYYLLENNYSVEKIYINNNNNIDPCFSHIYCLLEGDVISGKKSTRFNSQFEQQYLVYCKEQLQQYCSSQLIHIVVFAAKT